MKRTESTGRARILNTFASFLLRRVNGVLIRHN